MKIRIRLRNKGRKSGSPFNSSGVVHAFCTVRMEQHCKYRFHWHGSFPAIRALAIYHVHPRIRNSRIRIGTGIPTSHRRIHPTLPCLMAPVPFSNWCRSVVFIDGPCRKTRATSSRFNVPAGGKHRGQPQSNLRDGQDHRRAVRVARSGYRITLGASAPTRGKPTGQHVPLMATTSWVVLVRLLPPDDASRRD